MFNSVRYLATVRRATGRRAGTGSGQSPGRSTGVAILVLMRSKIRSFTLVLLIASQWQFDNRA